MYRKTFSFEGARYDVRAATREELAVKVAMKKRDLEENRVVVSKSTPVCKWTEKWLETYKLTSVSASTYAGYRSRINVHINPAIGRMLMKDVKPLHLQKILNNLNGYSKDYIAKVEYTLVQIFDKALQNNLIISNPASNLTKPKALNGTHRAITESERKWILDVADYHKHGLWIKIMLYCGLRPGETLHLQGRNFDMKNKVLKIEISKTQAGKRQIPIPDVLIPSIAELHHAPYEYVFKNEAGRQITNSNIVSMWANFKRELNIAMGCAVYRNEVIPPYKVAPDLFPYCLRHTFCTDLQAAGVPINVAKELMGHTDISITSKIYTHQSEEAFDAARQAINKYQCGKHCGSKAEKLCND